MRLLTHLRRCLIAGATFGLLMPQINFAAERTQISPIRDVALQQGGTLRGAVLSPEGQGAAGKTISLVSGGELVAEATLGEDGRFVISGLRPGVYSVAAGDTQNVLRLWSATAAPPAAAKELLLVEGQSQVVRGALGRHLPRWDHPLVVGGLLITAGLIGGVIGYNLKDSAS